MNKCCTKRLWKIKFRGEFLTSVLAYQFTLIIFFYDANHPFSFYAKTQRQESSFLCMFCSNLISSAIKSLLKVNQWDKFSGIRIPLILPWAYSCRNLNAWNFLPLSNMVPINIIQGCSRKKITRPGSIFEILCNRPYIKYSCKNKIQLFT